MLHLTADVAFVTVVVVEVVVVVVVVAVAEGTPLPSHVAGGGTEGAEICGNWGFRDWLAMEQILHLHASIFLGTNFRTLDTSSSNFCGPGHGRADDDGDSSHFLQVQHILWGRKALLITILG